MKSNFNKRVVLKAVLAFVFFILAFTLHWLFLIPVAVLIWLNQKELLN